MAAGNAGIDGLHPATSHKLGFFHRTTDRLGGGFDIHHHAPRQTGGGVRTYAHDFQLALGGHLTNDCHHLGRTDVQPHQ